MKLTLCHTQLLWVSVSGEFTTHLPPQLTPFPTFLGTGMSCNVLWIGTHSRRGGTKLSSVGFSMGGQRVSEELIQYNQQKYWPQ